MSKPNLNKHGAALVSIPGRGEFTMTPREYDQLGVWIAEKQQYKAMRWWSAQFDIPLSDAAYCINRLQIAQQYGDTPAAARNLTRA